MDRILLVEDSEPFRQLVSSILQENSGPYFIEQAADGLEGVQKAEKLKPDLILLDIGLPKLNGIDAAKLIRKRSCNSRIVFSSQENDCDVVKAALDTGALGYVHKPRAGSELRTAVETALRGGQFVSHT
jgi:DNA-binding NarL/FixJ family response regulator